MSICEFKYHIVIFWCWVSGSILVERFGQARLTAPIPVAADEFHEATPGTEGVVKSGRAVILSEPGVRI